MDLTFEYFCLFLRVSPNEPWMFLTIYLDLDPFRSVSEEPVVPVPQVTGGQSPCGFGKLEPGGQCCCASVSGLGHTSKKMLNMWKVLFLNIYY